MAHKVRVDIKFSDMEQYLQMKQYLDNAGIKFDSFVTFALNDVWNRMLEEYGKQLKTEVTDAKLEQEVLNELASVESTGDTGTASTLQGAGTEA